MRGARAALTPETHNSQPMTLELGKADLFPSRMTVNPGMQHSQPSESSTSHENMILTMGIGYVW